MSTIRRRRAVAPAPPQQVFTGRPPVLPPIDPSPGSSRPGSWSTAKKSTGDLPAWKADLEQARFDAAQVLGRLDFSQRDILLVVPGTGDRGLLNEQHEEIAKAWPKGGVSVGFVDYDTTWNFSRSVPQGMETLRLVLAGIAAKGAGHRVFLIGQSQGALLIGEAMREPAFRAMVTRASILGHPWISRTDYSHGADPKVWEHTNPDDPLASHISGSAKQAVEAISMLLRGDFLGAAPAFLTQGPFNLPQAINTAIWAVRGKLGVPHWLMKDPHSYVEWYEPALKFIRDGAGPVADAVQGVHTLDEATRRAMIAAVNRPFDRPYVRD
jgi:hypothetical protein